MQLKAGTYTFNPVLSELMFEQSIDITATFEDNGAIGTVKISKLAGVQGDYFTLMGLFYSIVTDGEEQLNEETPILVYGGAQKDYWHLSLQTHTITEDTEVNDTFGEWYKANTDYNTVNGSGESVLGLRRFVDNPDIASLSDIVPAETLESDLTDFYMEYTCNGVTYNLLIGQINEGAAGGYGLLYFNDEDVEICNPYLTTDGWDAEYGDEVRNINITKAPQSTELYAWLLANTEAVEETPEQPETPTKKFTRLYLGEVAYSSNGKRFRKLQTEEYVEPTLEAGLYDADDNLVASWDTLVNTYGMDVGVDYTSSTYKTDTRSPYYVLTSNGGLANGSKIVIDKGLNRLGNCVFYKCTSLTSVVIGDSVTSIGNYAFRDCTSLVSITIPDSVTSIGYYVFSGCTSLTSIEIPNSVTSIGNSTFSDCSSLTSITIPDSVTNIGNYAFKGCTSITSIEIPDSVMSIGNSAFYRCTSLTSITIPDSVKSIGNSAFGDCSSLTSITIPDSVKSIGEDAFYNCTALAYNEYDNTVYLGQENNPYFALVECKDKGVTSCEIHSDTKVICSSAFEDCTSLTSIEIPDSVTGISEYAFSGCSALKNIIIGNSVKIIGHYAFYGCTSLTSVVLGNSVTEIQRYAFGSTGGTKYAPLTSIIIPISVTYIGSSAFWNIISTFTIHYEGTIEQWNAIEKNPPIVRRYTSISGGVGYSVTVICVDGTTHTATA